MAATFLCRMASKITHTATEDFTLDDPLIKPKGDVVSPVDLITAVPTYTSSYSFDTDGVEGTLCSDVAAAFVVCMCHRLHQRPER